MRMMKQKPRGRERGRERDRDTERTFNPRGKLPRAPKFVLPKDAKIDYKNLPLLQKFVTERGKMVSRRISGVTAAQQREIAQAVKRARFLALLSVGSRKR